MRCHPSSESTRRPARSLAAVLLAATGLGGCSGSESRPGVANVPMLHLVETASESLPASWVIRDLAPMPGLGELVFLLDHPRRLVWWPDTVRSIRIPNRDVVGIRSLSDGSVEVVDARFSEVVIFHGSSHEQRATRISGAPRIWVAEWIQGVWWILAGDSAAPAALYRVSGTGRAVREGAGLGGSSATMRLSALGGRPVASMVNAPFDLYLHRGGSTTRIEKGAPPDWPPDALRTAALRVVPVDEFGVQTIVDLTSERRSLRLLDPNGATVREAEVGAPLAIVRGTGSSVLALRISDRVELVTYGWEWRQVEQPKLGA